MPDIPEPSINRSIVDEDGRPTDYFLRWLTSVTRMDLIIGSGSPEGIVTATVGRLYMDSAGTTEAILYVKRDADISGNTGS